MTSEIEAQAGAVVALFRGELEGAREVTATMTSTPWVFSFHTVNHSPSTERAYELCVAGKADALQAVADSAILALPDTSATRALLQRPYRPLHPGLPWSHRGLLEAFRGDREEAIRWARAGAEVLSLADDAREHVDRRRDLMDTYLIVGDLDAALGELAFLLGRPSPVGVGCLRLHPFYTALRAHPRFEDLVSSASLGG